MAKPGFPRLCMVGSAKRLKCFLESSFGGDLPTGGKAWPVPLWSLHQTPLGFQASAELRPVHVMGGAALGNVLLGPAFPNWSGHLK